MRVTWPQYTETSAQTVRAMVENGRMLDPERVTEFEERFARYLGVKHVVGCSSCTHALHLAVEALCPPDAAVAVPALGFWGTAHAVLMARRRVVFVDVGDDGLVDFMRLEAVIDDIGAAIVVHLNGVPCDMRNVRAVMEGKPLIEDACQAHGSRWRTTPVGTIGDVGCFSFNEVKSLPAGQGGALATNDPQLAMRLRAMAGYGEMSDGLCVGLGFAYGMHGYAAVLATEGLHGLDGRVAHAEAVMNAVASELTGQGYVALTWGSEQSRVNWHKARLVRVDPVAPAPDEMVRRLVERGVPASLWMPRSLHEHPVYGATSQSCPVAGRIARESFILGDERYPIPIQPIEQAQDDARVVVDILKGRR